MPALRDIRRKIEAVKRIGQITKAMNMVASAKLRTLQQRLEGFRPYRRKFEEVINNILGGGAINIQRIPFLQKREVKKIGIILITADKGLCGAFNSNLIREKKEISPELEEKMNQALKEFNEQFKKNNNIEPVPVP